MTPDSTTPAYWIDFLTRVQRLSGGADFPYWRELRAALNPAELAALRAAFAFVTPARAIADIAN